MPTALHLPAPFFPTSRAGASNPGDGNISYGTGKPGTARSTTAVRRGSSLKTQSPAASPRPRHRGPLLAGQPASLLLACTCGVGVPANADGGGDSIPYTPQQCMVRDLPPPPSRTLLPCGPRSAELLAAPLPFLRFCPVRPGGVYKNIGGGCCSARSPPRSATAATAPPAWPPA